MMTGVDVVQVHYRGSGPALPNLIGGQVQAMFDPIASSIAHIRSASFGLGGDHRDTLGVLPDIPTVGDFVPGYEATVGTGLARPKTRPPKSSPGSTRKSTPPSPTLR